MKWDQKSKPDEMEQHIQRQAAERTCSILKKFLLGWCVLAAALALVMSHELGYGISMTLLCLVRNAGLPLLCCGVLRLVHHVALLVYQSRTGDESAHRKLVKLLLLFVALGLFLVWVFGSLADLVLRA